MTNRRKLLSYCFLLAALAVAASCAYYVGDTTRDAPTDSTSESDPPRAISKEPTHEPASAERAKRQVAITQAQNNGATQPDRTVKVTGYMVPPPPGVHNGLTLYKADRDAKVEIQAALTSDVPDAKTYDCLIDLSKRIGRSFAAEWTVQLHIEAREGRGEVLSLEDGPEGDGWPEFFDDEAKRCINNALVGVTYDASHKYTYDLLFPLCAKGSP